MRNCYQSEVNDFKANFEKFRKKKIVLYGIGRYTATLIPNISDYNIIGLMDRNIDNIGKFMYGLPILSKEQVNKNADIVIINTSENYWKIIFMRISDLDVPIYYLNGEKAYVSDKKHDYNSNPYWNKSYSELKNKVRDYDIISFDVFDTLIMWRVYLPQDIYKLIELEIKRSLNIKIDFYRIRLETELQKFSFNMSLDEIYRSMNKRWKLPNALIEKIKQIEINVTKKCIRPRKEMVALCNELIDSKIVFFLSDMYLSSLILKEILLNCGIKRVDNLWISCEIKADKRSGSLWKKYTEKIGGRKKLLHIGDNYVSDIKKPQQFGINTYYIMSSRDMLENSSIGDVVPNISSLNESIFLGSLCAEIFNSPFALCEKRGLICIKDYYEMGYFIFGGMICSFLLWLIIQAKEKKISRLVFLARDGYFLEKDYLYIKGLIEKKETPQSLYLAISRRVALVASYTCETDIKVIKNFPYRGMFYEYMFDRFNIVIPQNDEHYWERIDIPLDCIKVDTWIKPYESDIFDKINCEKMNYKKYLDKINLQKTDAIVDLWFYGTNQYYLSKIVNMGMKGFYFAVNLSEENKCYVDSELYPCFQKENDLKAEQCNIYKNSLWIESFLTAPYGMIKAIDENGEYICAPNGKNQMYFEKRELINEGVCKLINDYMTLSGGEILELDRMFIDNFYGEVLQGNIEIESSLKKVFYYDNSMVKKEENPIFE